jgi:hypothetical protein
MPMNFNDVVHCVVIPNFCEPSDTLSRTLDTLQEQSVAGAQLVRVGLCCHILTIPKSVVKRKRERVSERFF